MTEWDDLEQLLLDLATGDLETTSDIGPTLAAYRGSDALLLAFLRPFGKGDYHDAIIELIALAMPLGADRLVFTAGARAWSWDDPMPPVIPGLGDLRQRVLVMTKAEGSGADVIRSGALYPFELNDGVVQWGAPLRDRPDGWIADALAIAVERRHALTCGLEDVRAQAQRCEVLGHRLAFSPAVADRLALDPDLI